MSDLILPRRKFLLGLTGLFCAPAIVRASSLMPVRSFHVWPDPQDTFWSIEHDTSLYRWCEEREFIKNLNRIYGEEMRRYTAVVIDPIQEWLDRQ